MPNCNHFLLDKRKEHRDSLPKFIEAVEGSFNVVSGTERRSDSIAGLEEIVIRFGLLVLKPDETTSMN